jgi:SAM-dependent methyltransferase
MPEPRIVQPPRARNRLYKSAGLALLCMNKLRYAVRGYRDPRPFAVSDNDRAIAYDLAVIEAWRRQLGAYLGTEFSFAEQSILELGPGADLGVGLALLALGARRYTAVDANELAGATPRVFYERLLDHLAGDAVPGAPESPPNAANATRAATRAELLALLDHASGAAGGRLRYVCRRDFDLTAAGPKPFDLVVSHAAFEHFDDLPRTFGQLRDIVREGGLLVAQVDLMTHTRWIRERDPLNIYRFGDSLYGRLRFGGAPNRVRPHEYERMLREAGWKDARACADETLPAGYLETVRDSLAPRFRSDENRMDSLSIYLCARR